MSHTRLWAAASIIAIVVVVGFILSVPHTRDVPGTPAVETQAVRVPSVTVHDAFKKGMHTITGVVQTPDACTVVTVQASLVGDATSTQSILVAISMPEDTGVCLQMPTAVNFSTTIAAPTLLPVTVTVNGLTASTSAP